MSDCLFCKIVKGEVSSVKIYEDDDFLGFMNIYPVAKGHALLIPKNHVEWMQDCNDELISKSFVLTKKLMINMKDSLPCDYVQVNIVGDQIPHFHIHLIPRHFNDNLAKWPTVSYNGDTEMTDYANKIKS